MDGPAGDLDRRSPFWDEPDASGREQGRLAEVVELAAEMKRIFEAARVHRETLAAVILFREAAEKREVTKEVVKRLQEYLKRAQREPGVRFDAR